MGHGNCASTPFTKYCPGHKHRHEVLNHMGLVRETYVELRTLTGSSGNRDALTAPPFHQPHRTRYLYPPF